MPSSVVKSFADKTGKSVDAVERLWDEAKASAKKQGHKETDDNFYAIVTGILKKMLKITESTTSQGLIMDEKKALQNFADFMTETAASATIKAHGPGDTNQKKTGTDDEKTRKDIEKNDETSSKSDDNIKTHSTSKTDSESQDSEGSDNAETRKKIEKNDKTKRFSFPGRK